MTPSTPPDWNFEDEFDGGEESCGRVIINLHFYMKQITPGTRAVDLVIHHIAKVLDISVFDNA